LDGCNLHALHASAAFGVHSMADLVSAL
jgi:hypothetical protein